jgi:hypothetical protein
MVGVEGLYMKITTKRSCIVLEYHRELSSKSYVPFKNYC